MERGTTAAGAATVTTGHPPGIATFTARMAQLSGPEIEGLAAVLRSELDSADGEVRWWRATLGVDRSLRCARRGRMAGAAAHEASAAVLRAADVAGVRASRRDEVTMVARAASDVARAIVAAGGVPRCIAVPAWDAVLATLPRPADDAGQVVVVVEQDLAS